MPLTQAGQKAVLDWLTGAATPTRAGSRLITLASQSPTSQSSFEGPWSPRMSGSFAAANSPQGSATNRAAVSCTATAIGTAVGWNLYDDTLAGTRWAYGTLSASVGCASGDTFGFPAGAFKITLV